MAKLSFFNQCHKQLHQHMFTFNILELCLTTSRCKTYEKKNLGAKNQGLKLSLVISSNLNL